MAVNTFQQAAQIRKSSLGELIRKNAVNSNQGAIKSVTNAISDKMAATAKGFSEKFDSLNIVRMLFGNTMAALLGRARGRSQADIEYFSKKGLKQKKGRANQIDNKYSGGKVIGQLDTALYTSISDGQRQRMRRGDGVADVAAKTFNFLKKSYDEKELHMEIDHNFDQLRHMQERKRHRELIDAIEQSKKDVDTSSKEETKKEKKPKKVGKKVTKEEPVKPKETTKTTPKPTTAEKTVTPSPSVPSPTATVATGTKVAIGAGATAAAVTAGGLLMPSEAVADSIDKASKEVGVDKSLMYAMAKQESGFNPSAAAGTSSAKGLYQFISSTWNTMVQRYGSKYPLLKQRGPTDPDANALAGALFIKENSEYLKSAGIPVRSEEHTSELQSH